MRTDSFSSYSVAGTPGRDRLSRSRSRAPGLADQICQILRVELRRGRDRRRRSSSSRSRSSSRGSSDSVSSSRSRRSESSDHHRCFLRSSRSSSCSRTRRSHRFRRSPCRHGRRFHPRRRGDRSCLRSPRRRTRPHDRAVSRSPPHLERSRSVVAFFLYRLRGSCDTHGVVQTTSFSAPVLSTSPLTESPPRHALGSSSL